MNVLTSVVALRYPPWKLPNQEGALALLPASRLFSLMWLPVGFSAAEAAMAGDLPWLMDLDGWLYLAALAPGGVPLALACGRLRRESLSGRGVDGFRRSGAGGSRGVGLRSPARRVVSRDLCRGGEPAGMVALRAGVPRRACPARAEAEDPGALRDEDGRASGSLPSSSRETPGLPLPHAAPEPDRCCGCDRPPGGGSAHVT